MQATDITPVGTITGISRKESPFDTQVIQGVGAGLTLPALIKLFANFDSFSTQGVNQIIAKQDGRDTNLSGSSSALPQGYQLEWYEWRASVLSLDANLANVVNIGVYEQMERIRNLGFIRYLATQSPLITAKLKDVASFLDSMFVSSTLGASFINTPVITSRGGKVIAVGGEPYTIRPQEQFNVVAGWPGAGIASIQGATVGVTPAALSPIVPYYLCSLQDGILTRAAA